MTASDGRDTEQGTTSHKRRPNEILTSSSSVTCPFLSLFFAAFIQQHSDPQFTVQLY
jgi:hypothetical protein